MNNNAVENVKVLKHGMIQIVAGTSNSFTLSQMQSALQALEKTLQTEAF